MLHSAQEWDNFVATGLAVSNTAASWLCGWCCLVVAHSLDQLTWESVLYFLRCSWMEQANRGVILCNITCSAYAHEGVTRQSAPSRWSAVSSVTPGVTGESGVKEPMVVVGMGSDYLRGNSQVDLSVMSQQWLNEAFTGGETGWSCKQTARRKTCSTWGWLHTLQTYIYVFKLTIWQWCSNWQRLWLVHSTCSTCCGWNGDSKNQGRQNLLALDIP